MNYDWDAQFLACLVFVITEELRLPLKRGGSTTLRRRAKRCGIEADECFWIANAYRMAGRRHLHLGRDPPPDLAIEVDVMHTSLDRLSIYAALKVPEVWRLNGDTLTFHILGADGKYASADRSRAFPQVAPAGLRGFVQEAREAGDQNVIIRQFRSWIRQHPETPAGATPPSGPKPRPPRPGKGRR